MDYRDFYEPPKPSGDSNQPEQENFYNNLPQNQNQGAFYNDPSAPVGQSLPQGQLYDTTPPAPEVNTMNRKIYFASVDPGEISNETFEKYIKEFYIADHLKC